MGKRPKRKVVLILVEGKSDRAALQIALPELFDKIDNDYEVFFPAINEFEQEIGGDITSKYGVHPRNIENNIYELFMRGFFDEQKILPKDIDEIIQIVDTDGAYIPDSSLVNGVNPIGEDKPYYDSDCIISLNVPHLCKRNECKRENLDYLSSIDSIKVKQKSIRYSVYYFSCNLDHYLNDNANQKSSEKRICADNFAIKYVDDIEGFADFLSDSVISTMDYSESWEYIKKGNNSLGRHTNIGILLKRLILCGENN